MKPSIPDAAPVSSQQRDSVKPASKKELRLVAKSSVSLLSAPMFCRSDGYGQDPVKEAKSTSYGAPTGILEAGSTITELSRTLDCKSSAWKLVRTSNGATGWIQEARLDKAMQQQLITAQSCRPSPQRARCVASLKEKLGANFIEADLEKGLLAVRPVAAPETKESHLRMKIGNVGSGRKSPRTHLVEHVEIGQLRSEVKSINRPKSHVTT